MPLHAEAIDDSVGEESDDYTYGEREQFAQEHTEENAQSDLDEEHPCDPAHPAQWDPRFHLDPGMSPMVIQ